MGQESSRLGQLRKDLRESSTKVTDVNLDRLQLTDKGLKKLSDALRGNRYRRLLACSHPLCSFGAGCETSPLQSYASLLPLVNLLIFLHVATYPGKIQPSGWMCTCTASHTHVA